MDWLNFSEKLAQLTKLMQSMFVTDLKLRYLEPSIASVFVHQPKKHLILEFVIWLLLNYQLFFQERDMGICGIAVMFVWRRDAVNKNSICSVAVISNLTLCDVCVFHVAVFGEIKLFAVLLILVRLGDAVFINFCGVHAPPHLPLFERHIECKHSNNVRHLTTFKFRLISPAC